MQHYILHYHIKIIIKTFLYEQVESCHHMIHNSIRLWVQQKAKKLTYKSLLLANTGRLILGCNVVFHELKWYHSSQTMGHMTSWTGTPHYLLFQMILSFMTLLGIASQLLIQPYF